MATLQVSDATASGQKLRTFTLADLAERLTVRELIRARIYQELQDHNRSGATLFRGLVQPTDTERTLNGFKFSRPRQMEALPWTAVRGHGLPRQTGLEIGLGNKILRSTGFPSKHASCTGQSVCKVNRKPICVASATVRPENGPTFCRKTDQARAHPGAA